MAEKRRRSKASIVEISLETPGLARFNAVQVFRSPEIAEHAWEAARRTARLIAAMPEGSLEKILRRMRG